MGSIGVFPRPEKIQTFNPNEELHVLAVDDSIVDRKVIERLLKISSCKVTTVDSGRRALQYLGLDGGDKTSSVGFDGLKVNMIITDYWMPGMTGYELLKKIKESSTFREIPVVIMSSENVLPRINRCLEEGAEEFLVKPVQLSDVKRLKNHLTREEVVGDELRGTTINNNKRKLQQADDVSNQNHVDNTISTTTTSTTTTTTTCSSSLESPSRRHRLASEISDLSEIF